MKLSPNMRRLLTLVDQATTWEGDERPGAVLTCYFVPRAGSFEVYGADAGSLLALERHGLIRRHRSPVSRYAFVITEDGIAALAGV